MLGGSKFQAYRLRLQPNRCARSARLQALQAGQAGPSARSRIMAVFSMPSLSRWPRAFALRTQKPFSALWKVTRSTRPASTSWVDGRAPSPCSGGDFDGRTLNARPRTYSVTKSRRMSGRRAHLCEARRHSRRTSPDPHKVVREPSADRQTVKSLQTRSPRRALVPRDDCAG